MLFGIYASISVVVHLFAEGYLSTGTWGDRQLRLCADMVWSTLTWPRLYNETSATVIGLTRCSPNACNWIATRVEQEKRKAAEFQLDCYIRADKTGQAPYFDQNSDDMADL
ncbi:hypothetical protein KFL_002010130 [Klebsormidium nitens]|uniref:Uncharacterized protein n=1 Tax=Klebsormidium nitens TaxID=105231 RepID=A0A0U9HK55_KLENI|nr:hypothetical protein KFL_002010130 [Klebsormidium nitens]|eukprot:GAQ84694.1 hypothetical protein KFL_002010130 [Klebsormidium nitens]